MTRPVCRRGWICVWSTRTCSASTGKAATTTMTSRPPTSNTLAISVLSPQSSSRFSEFVHELLSSLYFFANGNSTTQIIRQRVFFDVGDAISIRADLTNTPTNTHTNTHTKLTPTDPQTHTRTHTSATFGCVGSWHKISLTNHACIYIDTLGLAEKVFRIDAPSVTHQVGRD